MAPTTWNKVNNGEMNGQVPPHLQQHHHHRQEQNHQPYPNYMMPPPSVHYTPPTHDGVGGGRGRGRGNAGGNNPGAGATPNYYTNPVYFPPPPNAPPVPPLPNTMPLSLPPASNTTPPPPMQQQFQHFSAGAGGPQRKSWNNNSTKQNWYGRQPNPNNNKRWRKPYSNNQRNNNYYSNQANYAPVPATPPAPPPAPTPPKEPAPAPAPASPAQTSSTTTPAATGTTTAASTEEAQPDIFAGLSKQSRRKLRKRLREEEERRAAQKLYLEQRAKGTNVVTVLVNPDEEQLKAESEEMQELKKAKLFEKSAEKTVSHTDAKAVVALSLTEANVNEDGTKKEEQTTSSSITEDEKLNKIAEACETILECIGEDKDREGLQDTPLRFARSLLFQTRGYTKSIPETIKNAIFHDHKHHEMVVVRNIEIFSMCEHHMLPFSGNVHIGYIPKDKLLALSKLARIADIFAQRLQVQERMTSQIADAIVEAIDPLGVGVVVECKHYCMIMRGVEKTCSETVTSAVRGCFQQDEKTRSEFFLIMNHGKR